MDVFLIPVGPDQHEPYCELCDESAEFCDESAELPDDSPDAPDELPEFPEELSDELSDEFAEEFAVTKPVGIRTPAQPEAATHAAINSSLMELPQRDVIQCSLSPDLGIGSRRSG